jgi:hypothetical protein
MEGKKSSLRSCLSSNFSDFIFALHSLTEGDYIYEVLKIPIKWNFLTRY